MAPLHSFTQLKSLGQSRFWCHNCGCCSCGHCQWRSRLWLFLSIHIALIIMAKMTHHLRKLNASIETIDIFHANSLVANDHQPQQCSACNNDVDYMSKSIESRWREYTYLMVIKLTLLLKLQIFLALFFVDDHLPWVFIIMVVSVVHRRCRRRTKRLPDEKKLNGLRPFSPVNTFSIRQTITINTKAIVICFARAPCNCIYSLFCISSSVVFFSSTSQMVFRSHTHATT